MSEKMSYVCEDFDTKVIHAGQQFDQWKHREVVPSIVPSVTFFRIDPTTIDGYSYSRFGNPTRDALQQCLAELDNGKHGLVFPSGSAATHAVFSLLKSGDHIVSCFEQFGGTRQIMLDYAEKVGIEIDFVDVTELRHLQNAIKPNTTLIWLETPSNPLSKITDLQAAVKVARSHMDSNIIIVVDNTLLTPYCQRPLEMGVDIVMYSLTKYMNGHNDVLGGALIVNDDELHKNLLHFQTFYGSALSPFDCFLVNRGLKTLSLRMERHFQNALAVAHYLETHSKVVKVYHPGLRSHPHYELAKRQCSGNSSMITIELKGTPEQTIEFVKNLKIFLSCGSVGSYASFVNIPIYVSHYGLPQETLNELGILDTHIRLIPGLESINDLINDLKQAFETTFRQTNA
ncbi:putative cystathionine gamma-lyase 2 [Contarinia nasturtii]|uniref:putative cystathionine gamma-lyase 2 n=1 Tax=Contarinia nasturtii TaxID=265458 RepID=UPI0012D48A77|nr:putative cystathionine gamma-lyase 2 [Contarinia nasturtii]